MRTTIDTNSIQSHLQANQERLLQSDHRIAPLMQKPLIIGASVSADRSSISPGKKLALRYTPLTNIFSQARGGRKGSDTLKKLQDTAFDEHTIVLALDLFFWDSIDANPAPALRALDQLLVKVSEHQIPLILGNIPGIMPAFQPSRVAINHAIRKKIDACSHCAVMDFDALYHQVSNDGYVLIDQRQYTLSDLVPDGLHLSDLGSDYLTSLLLEVLKEVA